MTMMFGNPFRDHTVAVERLATAGIAPPKEWTDLLNRYREFSALPGGDAQRRLTQAILDNDTDADLDELRAFALMEAAASPQDRATVTNAVQAAVTTRLVNIYEPSAAAAYDRAAAQFDKAAQHFTRLADTIDADTDADVVVTLNDPQRKAWGELPIAALGLETALAVLREAAWLCGIGNIKSDETTIALALDTDGVDRRELWSAWEAQEGRCGRWGAIHKLGAPLAAADLDSFTPYRRPLPMEEKWVRVEGGIGHRRVLIDPEVETAQ